MLERLIVFLFERRAKDARCQITPPNTRGAKKQAIGNLVAIKLSQYHICGSGSVSIFLLLAFGHRRDCARQCKTCR